MSNNLTILFVDATYIKERSTLMTNIDDDFITPNIFTSQDIHIQTILGSTLYEDMLNNFVTSAQTFSSAKYVTLNDNYIQPCLMFYTLYESMDDLYAKITNKSILVQNSENSTPITETYLSKRKDDFLNKAEYYSQRLTNYLLKYQTTYDKYLNITGDETTITPEINPYLVNGWYLKKTNDGKWCSGSPYERFHNL